MKTIYSIKSSLLTKQWFVALESITVIILFLQPLFFNIVAINTIIFLNNSTTVLSTAVFLLATTLNDYSSVVATTNHALSSPIEQEFYENYKRTWQGVSNVLLFYLYYRYMVCVSDK